MKPSLIRSYLFISLGITLLFIALGVLTLELVHRANSNQMRPFDDNFPIFFAKLVEDSAGETRTKILNDLKELKSPVRIWLLADTGQVLFSSAEEPLPFDFSMAHLPMNHLEKIDVINQKFSDKNGPPSLTGFGPPGLPGRSGPGGWPPISVVKLSDPTYTYLVFGPKLFDGDKPPGFFGPLLTILIAILLASAVSVAVLFLFLKKTSAAADKVLDSLKSGDLKARFPIKKMNEIGNLMYRFNLMADEIEGLFEKVKEKERSRIRILQELAHDLRTPLASLQNMLTLMFSKERPLPSSTVEELLGLSLKETTYVSQLVEDLLLLGRISEQEPISLKKSQVDISNLIENEIETVQAASEANRKNVTVTVELDNCPKTINGDAHLLTRLFRNVIDNAFSFSEREVKVFSKNLNEGFEIIVQNDGNLFNEEALKSYGERRLTRLLDNQSGGRISIGLGSVIIKTIAALHGIVVTPLNSNDSGGKQKTQARITIFFPKGLLDQD